MTDEEAQGRDQNRLEAQAPGGDRGRLEAQAPGGDQSRLEAQALVEGYLGFLENVRRLSYHTLRAYESDLRSFLDWCKLEGVRPLDASRIDLRRYMAYMRNAGYANKTINRRISSLRSYYTWVEREGRGNAAAALSMRSRKMPQDLPKTLTDTDVAKLLDTCDVTQPEGLRDRAFLELLYATGARISEVAALSPEDVDLAGGQVLLFGKRSKERIVPLYEMAVKTLEKYLCEARPQLVAASHLPDSTRALFVSVRGNSMSADTLRRVFHRHMSLAGLDSTITPHAIRHTFATELLSGGADLKSVQELLGHESLSTTQIYTHLSIEGLKRAAQLAHPRA